MLEVQLAPCLKMTSNDDLKALLISLQEDVKDTKTGVNQMTEDIKTLKQSDEKLLNEVQDFKKKQKILEQKNEEMEVKVKTLEDKLESILIRERRNNIFLYNIEDTPTINLSLLQSVLKILKDCKIIISEDQIDKISRIGKLEGKRPVLITFKSSLAKSIIYENAQNLQESNIYFSNDYTPGQQQTRRELTRYKHILKENGKTAIIKGTKISLDGTLYDLNNIRKLVRNQNLTPEEDQQEDNDSDGENSSTSIVSTASTKRKRGRPRTVNNPDKMARNNNKKMKHKENNIKLFLQQKKENNKEINLNSKD